MRKKILEVVRGRDESEFRVARLLDVRMGGQKIQHQNDLSGREAAVL
jgi:hypothetical protein